MDAKGNMTLGQTPVTIDQLRTNLMAELTKHPKVHLFIWVDKDKAPPRESIAEVMDSMLVAGTGRVGVSVFASNTPRTTALTAEQAGALAGQLANEKAQSLYGIAPFTNHAPAEFIHGSWAWHGLQGWGSGDIEAKVKFEADGAKPSVSVTRLDSGRLR
jgi:hypothetical protein